MYGYSLTKSEMSDEVKDWGFRFFRSRCFRCLECCSAQGNLPLQGGAPPLSVAPHQGVPAPLDAAAAPQGAPVHLHEVLPPQGIALLQVVPPPQGAALPQGFVPDLVQGDPPQISGLQIQAQGLVDAGFIAKPFSKLGHS